MIKTFTSPVDGLTFEYQILNGQLEYKIEGTDWQDFVPEDRRAYSEYEYREFLSLLDDEHARFLQQRNSRLFFLDR